MRVPPPPAGFVVEQWQSLADEAAPPDAVVSIWFGTLDGRPLGVLDPEASHYAASTMKLPLVTAAYRLHEKGALDLDAAVPVHNSFASVADGSPFGLDEDDDQDPETWARLGATCALRELARHSIVRSGNLATNLVLEQVGVDAVGEVLADAGCSARTTVRRGIEDHVARLAGINNLVTAHDLGRLLTGVATRSLASRETCEQVERVLAGQEYRDGIPAGVPAGTYTANKTGWVTGLNHDAALVRPADAAPYVLVVLTTGDLPEERALRLTAEISAAAWEVRPR